MGHVDAKSRRLGRATVAGLLVLAAATLLWACLQPPLSLSSGQRDGGSDGGPRSDDSGAPAILGLFTISGCEALTFPAPNGEPRCVGTAPLKVRLVLLAVGATSHRFQLTRNMSPPDGGEADGGAVDGGTVDGGGDSILDEASSRAEAPTVILPVPDTYLVSLGVAGPGGTAASAGVIIVKPAALGAACDSDDQCDSGLHCICGKNTPAGSCKGGLSSGLCTQSCDGTACPTGSVCVDLSRTAPPPTDAGVSGEAWRQPICVPGCTLDPSCRGDLVCRELPVLNPGQPAGGTYTWKSGCFAPKPGGVGDSCLGSDDKPDPASCALAMCDGLGLRNLCTAPCAPGCPTTAACATWNSTLLPAPPAPRCVARCDATHPCADPLLDCLPSGGTGALGFTLTEPAGTTVCAPRRCTAPTDCPGGQCLLLGGASFCTR